MDPSFSDTRFAMLGDGAVPDGRQLRRCNFGCQVERRQAPHWFAIDRPDVVGIAETGTRHDRTRSSTAARLRRRSVPLFKLPKLHWPTRRTLLHYVWRR